MKPFFKTKDVNMVKLKKLLTWCKKNEKFGAYAVCNETDKGFNVQFFCPVVSVALNGKRYIKSCQ